MQRRSILLTTCTVAIVAAIFAISSLTTNGDGHNHNHVYAGGLPLGAAAAPAWGDIDCDGSSNSVDALKGLQFVAGLPVQQEEGCPEIGSDQGAGLWGDWDCGGAVNSVDALQVLRNLVALPVQQTQPCPAFGEALGIDVVIEELVIDPGWKDYGDAPDGAPTGYSSGAAAGSFPTQPDNSGPSHPLPFAVRLGEFATAEDEPLNGSDSDDGLQTLDLSECSTSAALLLISHGTAGQAAGGTAYLNILADWNRDGDWSDAGGCAPEWALQNVELDLDEAGTGTFNRAFEFVGGEQVDEFWLRISITREPYDPAAGGEVEGETEDYLVTGGEIAGRAAVPVQPASPAGVTNDLFFCKGRVIPHGVGMSGFTVLQPAIEQTESSRAAGFRPTSIQLGSAQPRAQDGSAQSEFQSSGSPTATAKFLPDGRARIDVIVFAVSEEDPPPRMEYYNFPFVVRGQSTKGAFQANVTCGIYIEHSGSVTSDIITPDNDGFRGGPGRAGMNPGEAKPQFIVVPHGERVVLQSDSSAPKAEQDGSKYDSDSLTVYDENLSRLNPTELEASAGIRVTVPSTGRGIIVDTIRDDRGHLSVVPLIIRINGKNADGDEFVDHFRIVVNHDDDMKTRDLIKKLLDDGLVLNSFGEDESFRVAYTVDGTSIRTRVPPFAGLLWDERTECMLGDDSPADSVRDIMFGSLAYVVDYSNGGSEIVRIRDTEGNERIPVGPDDDDDDCFEMVSPPGFDHLTNNGALARIRHERGNICAGRLVATEFELAQPGIPFRLIELDIEEVVLRSAGGEAGPAGGMTTPKKPIAGSESHRYPNCFEMGGGKYGIVASTPGEEGRSVLAYVPYLPCGGTCVSGTSPQGTGGFVLLEPAGANEHFVSATVSPDGSKIAFQYDVRTELGGLLNAQIYVGGFNPSIPMIIDPVPVTSEGFNALPTWSPDSQQLAFVSTRDGNLEIYVMNADGSEQTNLTNTPGRDESFPSWQNP